MKEKALLPRIGIFKADRRMISHIVLVDGEIYKPLCIRMPLKHGKMLTADASITCDHCKTRGWTRSLGRIGAPVDQDEYGRYVTRQTQ